MSAAADPDVYLYEYGTAGDVVLRCGDVSRFVAVHDQGRAFEQDARLIVSDPGKLGGPIAGYTGLPSDLLAVYLTPCAETVVKRSTRSSVAWAYLNRPEVAEPEDGGDGGLLALLGMFLVLAVVGAAVWLI